MTHEEKKVAKIIEELTMFFFAIGAKKIESGIEKQDKKVIITFYSDYDPEYEYKLNRMDEYLNQQKNDGVEDIYWELAGSGDPGETSQLLLIGMMIDEAQIETKDNTVCLKLYKEML